MREIKFRAWSETKQRMVFDFETTPYFNSRVITIYNIDKCMQYTGLKDKNGSGLTEVYEGDIISLDGTLKGNIYENDKESTDIVIPQLGTKAWNNAYKEAVDRGYDYSE